MPSAWHRPAFKGVLEVNGETGRQQLIHKSMATHISKQLCSALIILLYIAFTISCALGAQMIRYIEPYTTDGQHLCVDVAEDPELACAALQAKKFTLLGSLVNL
eukprot:SAG22_NODE_632_length_8376_cov_4.201160_4_plen_104_part_00